MKNINPPYSWLTISLWGICFISYFAVSAQIKETPKQRLTAFITWYGKTDQVPFEGDCFEADGVDITKIDMKCIQKYIQSIEKTGLFSSLYIKGLQQEFIAKQAQIKKNGYAEGIDYDRYTLSQDPPSDKDLQYALNNNSFTTISNTKAKVTINVKKPYKITYIYSMDLESNVWKITKIESKEK
ncbi:hypothetical protein EMA8858_01267 [Emticicia aquatica]|jgi:hypothetical protein|uniref:DUF3828 domain-containing protein n=1 Tax=Emticicia aquatica TaxID=1681835 RepID=A0ABM9AN21_9BACT|nr:hypothetical protein [Emticicia aquatica]CAH0995147.1 hypothetical protein EMA8858_01267 [Emticicia aquatica]